MHFEIHSWEVVLLLPKFDILALKFVFFYFVTLEKLKNEEIHYTNLDTTSDLESQWNQYTLSTSQLKAYINFRPQRDHNIQPLDTFLNISNLKSVFMSMSAVEEFVCGH
mgnify:CR=1 FL=1